MARQFGHTFYDFFAGGGMAGIGLGHAWNCLFANDLDPKKAASYRANHTGGSELLVKSIEDVIPGDLPGMPDLAWASFPCQDLSLAGKGAGLDGERSGMFSPFWDLICALEDEGRAPKIIVIENVRGLVTNRGGTDFAIIADAFANLGYQFGAMIIDAVHFLPQSRPRFFLIGVHPELSLPSGIVSDHPNPILHPRSMVGCKEGLSDKTSKHWIWWDLDLPSTRNSSLTTLIEDKPIGVEWHTPAQTDHLLSLMTDVNLAKIEDAKHLKRRMVGAVYRRTRRDKDGTKRQRAEVRFDDVAGCLRTPGGGSSRQTILVVENDSVRSRLLSSREAAALMGLPDDYVLPDNYNEAYKLAGDGVAVPVVKFLAEKIFEPILEKNLLARAA